MRIAAMFLTFIVSLLFLFLAEWSSNNGTFNVSKVTLQGVSGSVFAAALFLVLQSVIDALSEAKREVYSTYYKDVADKHGIKELFSQRGGDDVVGQYRHVISRAKNRIWAVGMTNRHFLLQNQDAILDRVSSHKVDVRISFWDPKPSIDIDGQQMSLIGLQATVEAGSKKVTADWNHVIEERQRSLVQVIEAGGSLRGEVRLLNTRNPAAFTCLIVDDDVFFFPFLAMPESTNHPTIRCDATLGIGKEIATHVKHQFDSDLLTTCVYHRHGNEDRINRIK
jgi:hypothetical protein